LEKELSDYQGQMWATSSGAACRADAHDVSL
jgi:hypothetical protein